MRFVSFPGGGGGGGRAPRREDNFEILIFERNANRIRSYDNVFIQNSNSIPLLHV